MYLLLSSSESSGTDRIGCPPPPARSTLRGPYGINDLALPPSRKLSEGQSPNPQSHLQTGQSLLALHAASRARRTSVSNRSPNSLVCDRSVLPVGGDQRVMGNRGGHTQTYSPSGLGGYCIFSKSSNKTF